MSLNTHGLSSIAFGTPTITGFITQTYDESITCGVAVEVLDETGNIVASRYSDEIHELTFDAYLTSGTLPTVGATFVANGTTKWVCLGINKKGEMKGFTKYTIKGKWSENLTLV